MRNVVLLSLLLLVPLASAADPFLYTHDASHQLATGDVGVVGVVGVVGDMGTEMTDIAFAPDGQLFAVSFFDLYEVDPVTAQAVRIDLDPVSGTLVGSLGFPNLFGLATADDGVLYGISNTEVFSVDTATGVGTSVVEYGGRRLRLELHRRGASHLSGDAVRGLPRREQGQAQDHGEEAREREALAPAEGLPDGNHGRELRGSGRRHHVLRHLSLAGRRPGRPADGRSRERHLRLEAVLGIQKADGKQVEAKK